LLEPVLLDDELELVRELLVAVVLRELLELLLPLLRLTELPLLLPVELEERTLVLADPDELTRLLTTALPVELLRELLAAEVLRELLLVAEVPRWVAVLLVADELLLRLLLVAVVLRELLVAAEVPRWLDGATELLRTVEVCPVPLPVTLALEELSVRVVYFEDSLF